MAVRIGVVSLLSVRHQQFCWKTNWKVISGIGHRAGPFSRPAVWLLKRKWHSDLVFCPLWSCLFRGFVCSRLWALKPGNLGRRFCWQCKHGCSKFWCRLYTGISGAFGGFISNMGILAFQNPRPATHLALEANLQFALLYETSCLPHM